MDTQVTGTQNDARESLAAFAARHRLTLTADPTDRHDGLMDSDTYPMDHWRVTLRAHGRRYTFTFSMGHAYHGHEPTVSDVLSSLHSDAQGGYEDFADFCAEFGYDKDSRKAESTWKALARERKALARLFGADFDAFVACEGD